MIVQLAGLPGTGKTTLATGLREHLGLRVLVLDKDRLRDTVFGPDHVEYQRDQDDLCVRLLHQAAAWHLHRHPGGHVVLDGRTCSRHYQVADVQHLARQTGHPLRIIECVCAEDTARYRLCQDTSTGAHPAANRAFSLYLRLKATAEPITAPVLRLNTDAPVRDCLRRALAYLTPDLAVHMTAATQEPPR
jgi:predicted kinase